MKDVKASLAEQQANIATQKNHITQLQKDHEEAVATLHRMEGALHVLQTLVDDADKEAEKMLKKVTRRRRTKTEEPHADVPQPSNN